jgi:hypothetical protein
MGLVYSPPGGDEANRCIKQKPYVTSWKKPIMRAETK